MKRLVKLPALAALVLLLSVGDGGADTGTTSGEVEDLGSAIVESVLRAIRLPEAAEEARSVGVPEEEVREVLRQARQEGLAAEQATAVLDEGTRRVREGGSPKNFGQSVKAMIAEGVRGRDLAAAIHAGKNVGRHAMKTGPGKAGEAGKGRKGGPEKGAPAAGKSKAGGGGGK